VRCSPHYSSSAATQWRASVLNRRVASKLFDRKPDGDTMRSHKSQRTSQRKYLSGTLSMPRHRYSDGVSAQKSPDTVIVLAASPAPAQETKPGEATYSLEAKKDLNALANAYTIAITMSACEHAHFSRDGQAAIGQRVAAPSLGEKVSPCKAR
jgi:hypothetical protein